MILRKHINRRIELQRKLIIQQNFLSSSSVQVWDRIIYGVVLNNFTLQSLNLPNYKMEALGHNLQWKIPAYEIIIPHSSSTDNWTFIPFSTWGGGNKSHLHYHFLSVFFPLFRELEMWTKGVQYCAFQVSWLHRLNILCSTLAIYAEDLGEFLHV